MLSPLFLHTFMTHVGKTFLQPQLSCWEYCQSLLFLISYICTYLHLQNGFWQLVFWHTATGHSKLQRRLISSRTAMIRKWRYVTHTAELLSSTRCVYNPGHRQHIATVHYTYYKHQYTEIVSICEWGSDSRINGVLRYHHGSGRISNPTGTYYEFKNVPTTLKQCLNKTSVLPFKCFMLQPKKFFLSPYKKYRLLSTVFQKLTKV
jgi:hypothetical protein